MCTTSQKTVISYIVIIVTWILGISLLHMHVWFLYSRHMDPCSYYMYYCSMLSPYSCYMIDWFPLLILLFPLLDTWAVDMRYIVPVSRYTVLCDQQSSGPVILWPVSCTYIVYLKYQIRKITWVWGRLDGWLGLVGWMSGSIVCPTAGDGVVLATICYSWAPVSRYVLAHWDSRYMLQP